jgi:hypothetical protein
MLATLAHRSLTARRSAPQPETAGGQASVILSLGPSSLRRSIGFPSRTSPHGRLRPTIPAEGQPSRRNGTLVPDAIVTAAYRQVLAPWAAANHDSVLVVSPDREWRFGSAMLQLTRGRASPEL